MSNLRKAFGFNKIILCLLLLFSAVIGILCYNPNASAKAAAYNLTIAVNDLTITYGNPLNGFTAEISGLLPGDTKENILSFIDFKCYNGDLEEIDFNGSHIEAGVYAIKAIGPPTILSYNITYIDATFTVEKKLLKVIAEHKQISYGEKRPVFTARFSGDFASGESKDNLNGELKFDCDAAEYPNGGSYAIIPYGLTSNNYEIRNDAAVLSVYKIANPSVLPAITIETITYNTIVISPIEGAEYSLDDGETYQDLNTFKSLKANTYYNIKVRFKETDNYFAGEPSSTITVATDMLNVRNGLILLSIGIAIVISFGIFTGFYIYTKKKKK